MQDLRSVTFQWNLPNFLRTPILRNICELLLLASMKRPYFFETLKCDQKIFGLIFLYLVGTENQVLELQSQQTNTCFKVNNRNTRKRCENMFKVNKEDSRKTSLTSFWCFIVKACVRYFLSNFCFCTKW